MSKSVFTRNYIRALIARRITVRKSHSSLVIPIYLNYPETDKNSCEGKISAGECFKLLDRFQNKKTPGNDGIPIEFYKKFWSLISDPFIYSVNECFGKR